MKLFGSRKTDVPIRKPRFDDEADGYAFRRSRTLTGTSSEQVRVAGESRAQIKSPRIKEHELRRHRRRLFLSLIGALVALGSLGWLISEFTAGAPEIRTDSQISSSAIQTKQYQDLINRYFASRPLERFRFVLREDTLRSYLQQEAPEVKDVSFVAGSSFARSAAVLTFREPLVGWQIKNTVYFIDQEGAAFQVNYFGSPSVTVHDASGIDPNEGAIASNRFLAFLGRVIAGVQTSGLKVAKVTIPPNTTREIDINLAGRPYRLKLQMDREPTGQVADVVAIVHYLDSKQITPQYVDVRVPSKAFYL